MKRKISLIFALVLAITFTVPFYASADTGPKPSVNITFEDFGKGAFYATLLSERSTNGPLSAYDGTNASAYFQESEGRRDIWQKFVDYNDADGFYFLQSFSYVTDGEYRWGYYPPDVFKVLVYFPDQDMFVVSNICKRYAFDSYFTMSLATPGGVELLPSPGGKAYVFSSKPLEKSYDFSAEILSLFARVVLTLVLEIALAILFGYSAKKQLLLLFITNLITNIALNVTLNIFNFYSGQLAFTVWYVLLEILIFALEAALYCALLPKYGKIKRGSRIIILYAFVSNAVSFGAGLALAHFIPGIF